MTVSDVIALGVSGIGLPLLAWICTRAAGYLREKTHNERLARLVDAIGRIAAEIAVKLPIAPGTSGNASALANSLVDQGMALVKERLDGTIAKLNPSDTTLKGMLVAELAKTLLQAPNKEAVTGVVVELGSSLIGATTKPPGTLTVAASQAGAA